MRSAFQTSNSSYGSHAIGRNTSGRRTSSRVSSVASDLRKWSLNEISAANSSRRLKSKTTSSSASPFRLSSTLSSSGRSATRLRRESSSSSISSRSSLFRDAPASTKETARTRTTRSSGSYRGMNSAGSYSSRSSSYGLSGLDKLSSKSKSYAGSSLNGSSSPSGASTTKYSTDRPSNSKLCCDKCDGDHETKKCPYYKKPRGPHKDEQKGKGRSMGGSGGNFILRGGRVVRQPGDGSCLFHSLAFGLSGGSTGRTSARNLRREIAKYMASNADLIIADSPLKDWIKWESSMSTSAYARRMSRGGWGGAIEMAACSHLKNVNVHVYERTSRRQGSGSFKRISCFDVPGSRRTVHILYGGRVHYDALVPT